MQSLLPDEGSVQVSGKLTVIVQLIFRDRYDKSAFEKTVKEWVTSYFPDRTSTGRSNYDLLVVGGRGEADTPDARC